MSIDIDIKLIKLKLINQLNNAKQFCLLTNENLSNSFKDLQEKDKLSNKLIFSINSFNHQLLIFKEINKSILNLLNDHQSIIKSFKENVEFSINERFQLYNQLKSIDVKKDLITNNNNNNHTLYDYIDISESELIVDQINIHLNKLNTLWDNKIINNIKLRFQNHFNYLQNEWNLIISFKENYLIKKDIDLQIDELIAKNHLLENEIVIILNKMNNQLDDCILFEDQLLNNNTPDTKLYDKIKKYPSSSLSELTDLTNNCDIINQNCKDINKFLKIYKNCQFKLKNCLEEINDFNLNILTKQVQNILIPSLTIINKEKLKIEQLQIDLQIFIDDSKKFIKSYHNLINEINRRKKLNEKVELMINSFQNDLLNLQNDDIIIRSKFLNENNDYLPQDLISNSFFESKFPEISVAYKLEDLPKKGT
ncbi:hypothetical protein DAPK24_012530 [Pichia kluyveri]|uniref:Autophagy-related protein 17 n=1 Tax=Pichia kluyveri TaxID=36015 RepID=A0AAV5R0E1_PICKL|nr:hypothetical protein DAPK24_012530 [Pichia kluyveri]